MKHVRFTIMIIMFTLLLPLCSGYQADAASKRDYLKIGLKFGSNCVSTGILKSDQGFLLGTIDGRRFEEGMPLPAYNEIVITNENGNIVVKDKDGILLSADMGSSGCIMPADYDDDGVIYYDGTPYRGGVQFLGKSNGTMTVINVIRLEHYVYGILNSELGYTNPKEALKAQAVVARSYAEQNLGKHSADGFDLCTSTHCQVYKGYSGEFDATNKATDETEGEFLLYDGEPVSAFYYKNSGGYTQNSEDVWSGKLPYLRAVKDEYSPSYPWSTSLSFEIIKTKLESAGFSPGTIQSVSINAYNNTGAVSELKIVGSGSTVYLKKENIRNVLGATIIKSNMFTLGKGSSSGVGNGTWNISNGLRVTESDADAKLYVISDSGKASKIDAEGVFGSNGQVTILLGTRSSEPIQTVTNGTVEFNGYGYGHGVGMPQDSAVEMAKQGFDYKEILEYFFTDIEVE
ncbi:SpoIID/LytB domain-containing protein [Anoxybacterium hadale]|uniref:SpoIID/LytB domain-containing protein n=1 Tax=Anoxybacterium hadale TaxID=3408580 RepID=UPI003AFFC591